MTALSFVWVHPYSQISGCDNTNPSKDISRNWFGPTALKMTSGPI